MPGPPQQIIGKLSASRCLIPTLVLFLLLLSMIYIGYIHRVWEYSRDDMISNDPIEYFVFILCWIGALVVTLPSSASVIFNHSAGLFVVGGNLIYLSPRIRTIAVDSIASMELGPELVFEGVASSIVLRLRSGRRIAIQTFCFKTPVPQMLASLQALGVQLHTPVASRDAGS